MSEIQSDTHIATPGYLLAVNMLSTIESKTDSIRRIVENQRAKIEKEEIQKQLF